MNTSERLELEALIAEQGAIWDDELSSIEERTNAFLALQDLLQIKLDSAIEFLEEHYPPHTRQVIVMTAIKERLQYITKEREKEYEKYAKHRDFAQTDARIAMLTRMESQLKAEYGDVRVFPIASYVTAEDMLEIKEKGFVKFMVAPAHFLSTYENSTSVKGDDTISV